jgi:hypothetical protein
MRSIESLEHSSSILSSSWGSISTRPEKTSEGTTARCPCWCIQINVPTLEPGMLLTSWAKHKRLWCKMTGSRSSNIPSTWPEVLPLLQPSRNTTFLGFSEYHLFPYCAGKRKRPSTHFLYPIILFVRAEELRKERKKATKNDAVVRLASAIHEVRQFQALYHPNHLWLSLKPASSNAQLHIFLTSTDSLPNTNVQCSYC